MLVAFHHPFSTSAAEESLRSTIVGAADIEVTYSTDQVSDTDESAAAVGSEDAANTRDWAAAEAGADTADTAEADAVASPHKGCSPAAAAPAKRCCLAGAAEAGVTVVTEAESTPTEELLAAEETLKRVVDSVDLQPQSTAQPALSELMAKSGAESVPASFLLT